MRYHKVNINNVGDYKKDEVKVGLSAGKEKQKSRNGGFLGWGGINSPLSPVLAEAENAYGLGLHCTPLVKL